MGNDATESIPCPHCHGSGEIEFSGVYADTLKTLRTMKEPVTATELARLLGDVSGMAMSNRLAKLELLGFATSKRYGRNRLYRPTVPATKGRTR